MHIHKFITEVELQVPCRVRLRVWINLNFSTTYAVDGRLWGVISVRGKKGDRDLVYHSATTYALLCYHNAF